MLNIYYIANVRFPTRKAHGYQIFKMCEAFSNSKVELHLIALQRSAQIDTDLFKTYDLENKFDVKLIKTFDYFKLPKIANALSYWLQTLDFLLRLCFLQIPKNAFIYSRSPEIIWLFNLRGYKTILELHSWPKSKRFLFNYLISKASKINVLTNKLQQLCLENNISKNNCYVIPDAVDLKRFDVDVSLNQARQLLGLPLNERIIGFFGSFKTLGKEKGLLDIIDALKILIENKIDVKLLAVGGGEEDIIFYKQIAENKKISDNIFFKTKVDHSQLSLYQKACDVLLMPFPYNQHYAFYMSPLKMFEYMASKRPIVASDLPSIREVLNEESCFFCQPDNPTDLSRAIKQALSDTELSQKLALKAYDMVKNYTWDKRAERIIGMIT